MSSPTRPSEWIHITPPVHRLGREPIVSTESAATAVEPPTTQSTDSKDTGRRKRKFTFPGAFTILFALTIIAVIGTWLIPAGSYSKLEFNDETQMLSVTAPDGTVTEQPATQQTLDQLGVKIEIEKFTSGTLSKPVSIPGTYEQLPANPAGIEDIPQTMVHGTIEAIDIIVFILVLGGLIGVVNATGAFTAGLTALTKKTKGREFALVFIVSLIMLAGGTTCGLEEEAVAFYPILVPVFLALGYDSIICVGAIFLAGSMGTTMSTINPFSVVIAANAAGITFTDGIMWRIVGLIVGSIVVVGYLWWYGKKVQANPAASYTYEDHESFNERWALKGDASKVNFDWRKKVILVLFVSAFPLMVWGVMAAGWWFPTMAASFLTIAIIVMFLAGTGPEGLGEQKTVEAFTEGASSLVGVSLIIGLARGINLVMEEGLISDTMLYGASNLVQGMSGPIFIIMMMLVFFVLGFVVPSSSGLAVLSMPILAPLADTVGIERYTVVCAYQWGQYAMLYLAPTGLVMATLQMLNMKYSHWLKFVWPMVVFVLVFGGILLVAQVLLTP